MKRYMQPTRNYNQTLVNSFCKMKPFQSSREKFLLKVRKVFSTICNCNAILNYARLRLNFKIVDL